MSQNGIVWFAPARQNWLKGNIRDLSTSLNNSGSLKNIQRGGGGLRPPPPFCERHILLIFHFLCFSFINIHFISFGLSLFYFILLFIYVSISFLYLIFHLWYFGFNFIFSLRPWLASGGKKSINFDFDVLFDEKSKKNEFFGLLQIAFW